MSEPQRRRLLDGLNSAPKPPVAPTIPEETIVETAVRHGFSEAPVAAPSAPAEPVASIAQRRQRKVLGRTEQFNVRLRPDTLAEIYAEANGRDIPLAQVIEEAIAMLRAHTN